MALGVINGTLVVKTFPDMKQLIGLHGLSFIYASIGVICIIWGALTIPDNRGKSLHQVEESYNIIKGKKSQPSEKEDNLL